MATDLPRTSVAGIDGAAASGRRARVQEADFDAGAEVAALQAGRTDIGAVVTFTGCVRADESNAAAAGQTLRDWGAATHDDPAIKGVAARATVLALELEHYPGMTERAVEAMIDEASRRFAILEARVIHRVGRLRAGDRIVWVGVAATHRRAAFEACEFLMDYLKTQAPFWKKETTLDGDHWVEARSADDEALARWGLAGATSTDMADDAALATLSRASP